MSAFSQRSAAALPAKGPSPRPSRSRSRRPVEEGDDPLFVGLLTTLSFAAAGFWVWVVTTPVAEAALPVGEDVARFVNDLPPMVIELPPPAEADAKADAKKVADEVARSEAPARLARPASSAVSPPVRTERLARDSLLIERIGHLGNPTNALEEVLGPDGLPDVTAALDQVHGDRTASRDEGIRRVARGGDLVVGIGGTGEGGHVGTGSIAAPKVRGVVRDETPVAEASAGDAGVIAGIVRTYRGRIDTCLEQSLKADPDLSGRVSVGWAIRGGRVGDVHLVGNTTGDAPLGACVMRAVRSFTFPATLDAEVAEMPWVVSAG